MPALAAGQCSGPIATVVNMRANQSVGLYYWGGIIDPGNLVTERWENNNSRAGNTVTVSGPDLIVTTQTVTRTSTSLNGVITYKLSIGNQVKNQGNASAAGFSVGYYLSTDKVYSTSDLFVCARSVTSLAAGVLNPSTGVTTSSCAFPSTTVKGTPYYVIGVADYLKAVAESNENNNATSSTATVSLP